MKKGFTLIELMAAIVILGVISLIAIPLVEQVLNEIGTDSYTAQIKNIRAGARQWAADDMSRLPSSGSNTTITLSALQQSGFVKKNLYNPRTKELFDPSLEIIIEEKNGNYVYYVGGDAMGQLNPNAPRISLVGESLVYVDQNGTYFEDGVTVKDVNGSNILNAPLSKTITNSSKNVIPSITTNILGTYNIDYSVTINGITSRTNRSVIVVDNVPPVLTIPSDTSISQNATTFDFMNGVSYTDNSPVVVTISSNLTLGIPGKYLVTYTATDTTGNKTSKTRMVTVRFGA